MNDETVQLKTLQTVLTIFQSGLHPEDEVIMRSVKFELAIYLLE
jgi:hypothetical protein